MEPPALGCDYGPAHADHVIRVWPLDWPIKNTYGRESTLGKQTNFTDDVRLNE